MAAVSEDSQAAGLHDGGPLPRAAPEAVGMSSERLARIIPMLRAETQARRLPGAVLAVARRGHLVFYEAIGYLDADQSTPMPLDAIFAIASMTKPIVGAAALMLLEEGRLGLADPVERYLPQLGARRVAVLNEPVLSGCGPVETVVAERSITIEDLMRHTSGLTYGGRGTTAVHRLYPASSDAAGASLTAAEFLDRLAAAPLLFQPGTVWDYGLSIDVLGLVVEAIAGQGLGGFLEQRLFRSLGMTDTGFQVPLGKLGRLARPLARDPDTGATQTVPDRGKALRFECDGAGLASTAADYLRFVQMLLDGGSLGGTRVLGRKTVEMMRMNRLASGIENCISAVDPLSDGYGFGLTVAVRERAGSLMGSPGDFFGNGAYGTHWWADPQEQLAVVFMAQTPGLQRRHYRQIVNALVYQAITD
ncbi:class A beta-lactamase-related serine hydrolase [Dankookia rubra]|uniref:Class A beta-lactamase-related serine hydrolase n=1 Tax=Dankookia rubra TaxID=1442381 RepID=A0A4R5QD39_9PROT|nr:serine hydrolase domain-containing protein [Dankookia rubra]TDH60713.1 class A beta-lactamase-related serine hydrolase [Dankookia rubra]